MTSERRVLVTGATGFVGRHVVEALAARGFEVHATSRRQSQVRGATSTQTVDLRDLDGLRRVVRVVGPTDVVHLAGLVGTGRPFADLVEANVIGTANLVAALDEENLGSAVVVASSSAVYPRDATSPIAETTRLGPTTPYGISKAAQELVAGAVRRETRVVAILRYFNVIGPGQPPHLALSAFSRRIVEAERAGGGRISVGRLDTRRDLVDVRDVAAATAEVVHLRLAGTFNVASGVGRSMEECLHVLLGLAHVDVGADVDPSLVRREDVPVQIGDASRLTRITGWQPTRSFEDTATALLDDWRSGMERVTP